MEIQDYIRKVRVLQADLPETLANSVLPIVTKKAINRLKRRIFTEGLAANQTEIGEYSNKPMTVTKNALIKKSAFVPSKKGGKSMQLKGGYKELKEVQGLKSNTVNLLYSGDLKNSIIASEDGQKIGFNNHEESQKAERLESKYSKKIFQLSEDEKLKMAKETATELRRMHKSYFYAN